MFNKNTTQSDKKLYTNTTQSDKINAKGVVMMANHITLLRKMAGYKTVKDASKALGISTGMLYQVEQDIKKPSIKLALKIMELYECSLEDIFLPVNTTYSDKV